MISNKFAVTDPDKKGIPNGVNQTEGHVWLPLCHYDCVTWNLVAGHILNSERLVFVLYADVFCVIDVYEWICFGEILQCSHNIQEKGLLFRVHSHIQEAMTMLNGITYRV